MPDHRLAKCRQAYATTVSCECELANVSTNGVPQSRDERPNDVAFCVACEVRLGRFVERWAFHGVKPLCEGCFRTRMGIQMAFIQGRNLEDEDGYGAFV